VAAVSPVAEFRLENDGRAGGGTHAAVRAPYTIFAIYWFRRRRAVRVVITDAINNRCTLKRNVFEISNAIRSLLFRVPYFLIDRAQCTTIYIVSSFIFSSAYRIATYIILVCVCVYIL